MVLDKTLILKGIAAAGAVAGGGVSVAYGTGAFKSQEEKDKEAKEKKKNEVNEKLTSLGLGEECRIAEGNFTSPTAFSKECVLDQTKFQSINFSNKPTTGNVTVEGWSSNITLKIENKEGEGDGIKFTFKNPPSDLTITGEGGETNKITLKKGSDKEFKEEGGKLSKVIDGTLKTKLKGYNDKFQTLSIPDSCRFDETEPDTSLECEVSDAELKKIKFSNKDGNNELSLVGLSSSQKIKLTIERTGTGNEETLKYKFKNENSDKITISGKSDEAKIVLKASSEREFKEEEDKLIKQPADPTLTEKLKGYNETLKNLSLPEGCKFDETEDDTSFECDISQDDLKKINFSNKDGENDLTVNGWNGQQNVKLKVEQDSASNEMSLSFPSVSQEITILGEKTKGKISLKNSGNKKFKVEEGKLTKTPVNETTKTKYQEFNKKLGGLDIPLGCRFDEAESDTKVTCSVSKEDLKKIKFWNKGSGDLTIEEDASFTSANLEVNGGSTNMKLVFKDVQKTVKITGGSQTFNLRSNSDEFEIRSEVLGQVKKAGSEGDKLGLTCIYSGLGNTGTCKAKANTLKVYVSEECKGDVNITNTQDNIFNFSEYEDGYNLTTKFTYIGNQVTAVGNDSIKLENGSNYEGKNIENTWYLSKKNSK